MPEVNPNGESNGQVNLENETPVPAGMTATTLRAFPSREQM